MGARIVEAENGIAKPGVLYDSTAGMAFGPTFEDQIDLEDFLEWVREKHDFEDPREEWAKRAGRFMELKIAWDHEKEQWLEEKASAR